MDSYSDTKKPTRNAGRGMLNDVSDSESPSETDVTERPASKPNSIRRTCASASDSTLVRPRSVRDRRFPDGRVGYRPSRKPTPTYAVNAPLRAFSVTESNDRSATGESPYA